MFSGLTTSTAIHASPTRTAQAMPGGIVAVTVHRAIVRALVRVLGAIDAAETRVAQTHVICGAVAMARAVVGAGLERNIASLARPSCKSS